MCPRIPRVHVLGDHQDTLPRPLRGDPGERILELSDLVLGRPKRHAYDDGPIKCLARVDELVRPRIPRVHVPGDHQDTALRLVLVCTKKWE